MAFIGFAIVMVLGVLMIVAGVMVTYASTQIGDRATAWPLLISAAGAAIVYWACHHAPIAITLTPS